MNISGTNAILSSLSRYKYLKTNISNLNVSCASTLLSLIVVRKIIGSATALTNFNYNAITNKPDLTVYAIGTNLNSLSSFSYQNISGTNNWNSLSRNSFFNISGKNAYLNSLTIYSF